VLSILAVQHGIDLWNEPCQHAEHVLGDAASGSQLFSHYRSRHCPPRHTPWWWLARLEASLGGARRLLRLPPLRPTWFRGSRARRRAERILDTWWSVSDIGTVVSADHERVRFMLAPAWLRRLPARGERLVGRGLEPDGSEYGPGGKTDDAARGAATVHTLADAWRYGAILAVGKPRHAGVLVVELEVDGGDVGVGVLNAAEDEFQFRRRIKTDRRAQEVWLPIGASHDTGRLVIQTWADAAPSVVALRSIRLFE
jgi:hypothetical protein